MIPHDLCSESEPDTGRRNYFVVRNGVRVYLAFSALPLPNVYTAREIEATAVREGIVYRSLAEHMLASMREQAMADRLAFQAMRDESAFAVDACEPRPRTAGKRENR